MIRRIAHLQQRTAFVSMSKRLATSDDYIVRPHTRGRPKEAPLTVDKEKTAQEAGGIKVKAEQEVKQQSERAVAATGLLCIPPCIYFSLSLTYAVHFYSLKFNYSSSCAGRKRTGCT